MKLLLYLASTSIAMAVTGAQAQGTFVYDQQSSVDGSYLEGAVGDITAAQPTGQSFTPGLPSVGFIRLYLYDATSGTSGPGTMLINLRASSITGPILATTDPVTLAPNFVGLVNFYFANPASVTPQTTYFFQPVVQTGSRWGAFADVYNYPGGMAFTHGTAVPTYDYWFREGILVPEPSSVALLALGGGILINLHRRRGAIGKQASGNRRFFVTFNGINIEEPRVGE